jgi:hypothetical protein
MVANLYALQCRQPNEDMMSSKTSVQAGSPNFDKANLLSFLQTLRSHDDPRIPSIDNVEKTSSLDELDPLSRKDVEDEEDTLKIVDTEDKAQGQAVDIEVKSTESAALTPPVHLSPEISQLLKEAQNPVDPITTVPKIVHFVYGLGKASPTDPVPFSITQYLAIKSALDVINADRVHLWMRNTPPLENKWWSLILELGKRRAQERGLPANSSLITMHSTRDVTKVFGKEVVHHAHKSDIIRLEALLTYGGIYLDMDVVAVKPFDKLLEVPCTMGLEQLETNKNPHGLCNAVIVCHRSSPWLTEWYNAYRKFNKSEWASLSVHLPLKLSRSYPHYVQALPNDAFFRPVWSRTGIEDLYLKNTYDLRNNYAVHLWGGGNRYRNQETFEEICALQTTWGRIARIALLAGNGYSNICGTKVPLE